VLRQWLRAMPAAMAAAMAAAAAAAAAAASMALLLLMLHTQLRQTIPPLSFTESRVESGICACSDYQVGGWVGEWTAGERTSE
jgi:hypothetical protein